MKFGYKEFFARLYGKIFDADILGNAAQVAFYFTFALFPLLLFLMTLFGFILNSRHSLKEELFLSLSQVMPRSAFALVEATLDEVTTNASGGKLTFLAQDKASITGTYCRYRYSGPARSGVRGLWLGLARRRAADRFAIHPAAA